MNNKMADLEVFLLLKKQMKEPMTQQYKDITQQYKNCFPEILRRISESLELLFGLKLKEVHRGAREQCDILINKMDPHLC